MNLWNLKCSKERLHILERTQAQKKHIVAIKNSCSMLKQNYSWRPIKHSSSNRSIKSVSNEHELQRKNEALVKKLLNINSKKASPNKFINITRTLSNLSQAQRNIRKKDTDIECTINIGSVKLGTEHKVPRPVQEEYFQKQMYSTADADIRPDYSKQALELLCGRKNKLVNLRAIRKYR